MAKKEEETKIINGQKMRKTKGGNWRPVDDKGKDIGNTYYSDSGQVVKGGTKSGNTPTATEQNPGAASGSLVQNSEINNPVVGENNLSRNVPGTGFGSTTSDTASNIQNTDTLGQSVSQHTNMQDTTQLNQGDVNKAFGQDAGEFGAGYRLGQQIFPIQQISENADPATNVAILNQARLSNSLADGTNPWVQNLRTGEAAQLGNMTGAQNNMTDVKRAGQQGIDVAQGTVNTANQNYIDAQQYDPRVSGYLDDIKRQWQQGLSQPELTALREQGIEGIDTQLQSIRRQAAMGAGARGVGGGAAGIPIAAMNQALQQRRNLERDVMLEDIGYRKALGEQYGAGSQAAWGQKSGNIADALSGLNTATGNLGTATGNYGVNTNAAQGQLNTATNNYATTLNNNATDYWNATNTANTGLGVLSSDRNKQILDRQKENIKNRREGMLDIFNTGQGAANLSANNRYAELGVKLAGAASGGEGGDSEGYSTNSNQDWK